MYLVTVIDGPFTVGRDGEELHSRFWLSRDALVFRDAMGCVAFDENVPMYDWEWSDEDQTDDVELSRSIAKSRTDMWDSFFSARDDY